MNKTIFFFFLQASTLMAYPSLFKVLEYHSTRKEEPAVSSGFIYVDKDHWCLWVNGQIVDSKHGIQKNVDAIRK